MASRSWIAAKVASERAEIRVESDARRRDVLPSTEEARRRQIEWAVSDVLCACGCGMFTRRGRGSQPNRYVRGHACRGRLFQRTPDGVRRRVHTTQGYALILHRAHPRASHRYVFEHILVAERALGRPLPERHPVHHVDHDRANNAPNNLVICEDTGYHFLLHRRERALLACGNPNWRLCAFCKEYDDPARMVRWGGRRCPVHRSCAREYQRRYRARRAS